MTVETYNFDRPPIPEAWGRRYGTHTHHIAVGFADGRVHARDLPLPPAAQRAASP